MKRNNRVFTLEQVSNAMNAVITGMMQEELSVTTTEAAKRYKALLQLFSKRLLMFLERSDDSGSK